MEVNIVARSLMIIVHTMGFIETIFLGTPQENGVSERMNGTIMEHAKSMRLCAGFPLQFWEDVVDIVVYLINIGPSSSLDGGIP
jgi:hypothetical protein